MPWDGCELHVADLAADGELSGVDAHRRRRTARSRSGSPSGARPATSSSRAIEAAGGTSSGSAAASARRSMPRRPSSGTRRGRSARGRSRSSETGASCVRYDSDGFTHFGVLDPEAGRLEDARPRARLVGARRTSAPRARTPSSSPDRRRSRTAGRARRRRVGTRRDRARRASSFP